MTGAAPRFLALSSALARMPHLPAMLGGAIVTGPLARADALLAWGNHWPARIARLVAACRRLPVLNLEDGFFRSVGLGKDGAPTVSIVFDPIGLHFDARRPSAIERLLATPPDDPAAYKRRGAALIDLIRVNRLDKYNLAAGAQMEWPCPLPDRGALVIDQVSGDQSIPGAGANQASFETMLIDAIAAFGRSNVIVKTHPDVLAGHARGHLTHLAQRHGVPLLDATIPVDGIAGTGLEIWTVSSTMGFEGLLRGIPVRTYGMPFYAGWGLTDDRARGRIAENARARRSCPVDIETMTARVLIDYSRFADPARGRRLSPEEGLSLLADWRQTHKKEQFLP